MRNRLGVKGGFGDTPLVRKRKNAVQQIPQKTSLVLRRAEYQRGDGANDIFHEAKSREARCINRMQKEEKLTVAQIVWVNR